MAGLTEKQNRARIAYEQAVASGYAPAGASRVEINQKGSAIAEAAKTLSANKDGTVETCRKRIWQVIKKTGEEVDLIDGEEDWTPKEAARANKWEKAARLKNSQLKKALEEMEDLRKLRETAFGLAPRNVRPHTWQTVNLAKSKRRETPVLFTSDLQIGEVVRREDTPANNEYNLTIFKKRYFRLIEKTIDLIETHHGGADHIVYLRGGDTISGGIHDELAETDEVPPAEQARVAIQVETAGIRRLLENFGRVTVYSVAGNHDRTTKKPRSKLYSSNSFEVLIQYGLEAQFCDPKTGLLDPRIKFESDPSGDILFKLRGHNFLMTHGDRIGTSGGAGFLGPAGPIVRGAKKVKAQYAGQGIHVDTVLGGHFHTPMHGDGFLFNGTLVGYSEYAHARIRAEISPPCQTLFFVHDLYGITAVRRIYVNGHKVSQKVRVAE